MGDKLQEVTTDKLHTSKAKDGLKKQRALQRKIKHLVGTGQINELEKKTLQNWAEMLLSDDPQIRAFGTEKVSKYIFAAKREHQDTPKVEINCNFIGIKKIKEDDKEQDIKK